MIITQIPPLSKSISPLVEWLPFRRSQEPPSEEAIPQEEPKKALGIGAPGGALGFDILLVT